MKYIFLSLLLSVHAIGMENKPISRQPSQEDIEKAITRIDELAEKVDKQNAKSGCRLTKPRVAAITTLISGVVSAVVTLGAIYGKCQQTPSAPPQ